MPEIAVELDPETVEALENEGSINGFDDLAAYLRWVIEHRGAIIEDDQRDRLLEAYRERFVELQRELRNAESASGEAAPEHGESQPARSPSADSAATDPSTSTPNTVEGSDRTVASGEESPGPSATPAGEGDSQTVVAAAPAPDNGGPSTTQTAEESAPTPEGTEPSTGGTATETSRPVSTTDGGRPLSTTETTINGNTETTPKPMVSDKDTETTRPASENETESSFNSMHLSPERVDRIESDPVNEDADVLGSVETNRLDELSRRAVAKTRKTLKRDVQTGLEYESTTDLSDDGLPPGEDVVDLEALSVPGRSTEVVDRRQKVAGRAIAYLRDERRARKADFVEALYEEHPAGYETADGWWRFVKQTLEQVSAVEGGDGSRTWKFVKDPLC